VLIRKLQALGAFGLQRNIRTEKILPPEYPPAMRNLQWVTSNYQLEIEILNCGGF
jgi:hypothetical protein